MGPSWSVKALRGSDAISETYAWVGGSWINSTGQWFPNRRAGKGEGPEHRVSVEVVCEYRVTGCWTVNAKPMEQDPAGEPLPP